VKLCRLANTFAGGADKFPGFGNQATDRFNLSKRPIRKDAHSGDNAFCRHFAAERLSSLPEANIRHLSGRCGPRNRRLRPAANPLLPCWTLPVPKLSATPRLSIVIPIGQDLAAFESTLISVLENRPNDCEVLVVNDGSYDDPFDLCDEVRFVVADSAGTIDLIAAGATAARARFVHILADGIQATCGWLDGAIEKFEHPNAAAVAPVIRHSQSGEVLAAGWGDSAARLCVPVRVATAESDPSPSPFFGPYLQASLWRAAVLQTLSNSFAGQDPVEASYAYAYLVRAAGWRCVLAHGSELRCDSSSLPWTQTGFRRGQRLRAIRSELRDHRGWPHALRFGARALFRNFAKPASWPESFGQAVAPLAAAGVRRDLNPAVVPACNLADKVQEPRPAANNHGRAA